MEMKQAYTKVVAEELKEKTYWQFLITNLDRGDTQSYEKSWAKCTLNVIYDNHFRIS
jgi:hypothetical protein